MSKSKAQLEAEYDGLDSTDDEDGQQMDVTEKDEDHEYNPSSETKGAKSKKGGKGRGRGGGTKGEATKKKKRSREEMAEEREALKEERAQKKKTENAAIKTQKAESSKDAAAQAEARLKYLLSQSTLFSHFGKGMEENLLKQKASASSSSSSSSGRKDRRSANLDEEDQELLMDELSDEEDEEGKTKEAGNSPSRATKAHTVLKAQPSIITGGKLRDYQLEGLNWIVHLIQNGLNGILADEMGLGKTLQSISVLAYMHQFKNIKGPHLIMVPKSTLSNWVREFSNFCPSIRVASFHGSKEERASLIQNLVLPGAYHKDRSWDVLVTTYEVTLLEKASLIKIAWKFLIIDEAHRLKNEASQFSQVVRKLSTQHRLLLTGTPLQNNLHELWALLNFLLPDVFASAEQFDEWFNLDVGDTEAKQRIINQLHKLLRPFMLRRLKADVEKSLPPKSETVIFAGMSTTQKELYKKILLRDIDLINKGLSAREQAGRGSEGGRTAILNIVMQLRKCVNHPYLFPGIEDRSENPLGAHLWQSCGKMVLLHKLLVKMKERGHRVLIFSQMTRLLDILEDYLISQGYQYCRIDGMTSYDDREDRISSYNAPNSEKFIFLLSTRAGGLGINLQTADTVIIYDSDWNPQADLQAQDRAHRIGQKKPVQVFRFVTEDTVEVKVLERAQQKLKLDAMVVQQGRLQEKEKKMSKAELLDTVRFGADKIFRSKESTISDTDIDMILEEGRKKTEAMNDKLKANDKGDLYDFRLDGGMKSQSYMGVDYSDKTQREAEKGSAEPQGMLFLPFVDPGKRERKQVVNYTDDALHGILEDDPKDKKKPYLPKHMRIPKMEDWQFYNKKRLREIHRIEVDAWMHLMNTNQLPLVGLCHVQVLTPEMIEEKKELIAEGFGTWSKPQFSSFLRGSAKFGRKAYRQIAKEVGKSHEDVRKYAEHFWMHGEREWGKIGFEERIRVIERGERKLEEVHRLEEATATALHQYENPWEDFAFQNVSIPSGGNLRAFTAEEDRFLLCLAHMHGNGAGDAIRAAVRKSETFRFNSFLQGSSLESISRRVEVLQKFALKEVNAGQAAEALARERVRDRDARERGVVPAHAGAVGATGNGADRPLLASSTSTNSMASVPDGGGPKASAEEGSAGSPTPGDAMEVDGADESSQPLVEGAAATRDTASPDKTDAQAQAQAQTQTQTQTEAQAPPVAPAPQRPPQVPLRQRPLDTDKVCDVITKIDLACREVAQQRASMNVANNVNSIRVYRRAVEYAKKTMPMGAALGVPQIPGSNMTPALANTAHDAGFMPADKSNAQMSLDAMESAAKARSAKAADAATLTGTAAANRLSALEDFDTVCNINLSTGTSHTTTLAQQQGDDEKAYSSVSTKTKGSKSIPEGILPRLAKLLVQSQSMGVNQVANHFLRWYPTLTKRQVDLKINELAVKEKLEEDHTKVWHIRPEFKYLLDLEAVEDDTSLGLGNRRGAENIGSFSVYFTDTQATKKGKSTPKTGFQAFAREKMKTIKFENVDEFKVMLIKQWDGLEPTNREAFEKIARSAQQQLQQQQLQLQMQKAAQSQSATSTAPALAATATPADPPADAPADPTTTSMPVKTEEDSVPTAATAQVMAPSDPSPSEEEEQEDPYSVKMEV